MAVEEPATVIDLTDFLPEDEATIEIASARKQPTGWRVTLAGPGHAASVAVADDILQEQLDRRREMEKGHVYGLHLDADVEREKSVARTVRRILGWSPVRIGGEVIGFSPDTARALLARPDMAWALRQIADALADDRAFAPQ